MGGFRVRFTCRALALITLLLAVIMLIPHAAYAVDSVGMHRLYNRWTGEHFYTASATECVTLMGVGWTYEGTGWEAPKTGDPVYRLYNPYVPGGDHHYTTDKKEYDELAKLGWVREDVGWYSGGDVDVYRQYNPYATTGTHNYTADKNENDQLAKVGWREEGVGWHAVAAGTSSSWPSYAYNYVNFYTHGGNEIESQVIPTGDRVVRPEDPAREGYTFLGWYTESTGGTKYDFSTPVTGAMILHAQWQKNLKYSYEAFYIDGQGSTWYNGVSRTLYIKTDNPDGSFSLVDDQADETWQTALQPGDFDDIDDQGRSERNNYLKVPGGYVVEYSFESSVVGDHTIKVVERDSDDYYYGGTAVGKTFTATFADYDAAVNEWIDAVVQRYTSGEMTPPEKMWKICAGLLGEFRYPLNDGTYLVFLAADPNGPFFLTNRWDSATSPSVLCKIAERVGGFTDIHNCYGDYAYGTPEWQNSHYYCKCVYQGEDYYFEACPLSPTGQIDRANIKWIDFNKTSAAPFDKA